jgi:adenylate cyclase
MAFSGKLKNNFLSKVFLSALSILSLRKTARRNQINAFIGLGLALVITFLMVLEWSPLENLEDRLLDYRFKIRGPQKPPDQVVIAAIDDKSIDRLGRWPWSREVLARLIERLGQAGAELIFLDIILSEEEKNDPLLGKIVGQEGNVILPLVFEFDPDSKTLPTENLSQWAFRSIQKPEGFKRYHPITARKVLIPVPALIREAMALGHINMFPDQDGTVRWEALAIEYNGFLFPSIDLITAALFLGVPPQKIALVAAEAVQVGEKRKIPTDPYGRSLIHYYGPEKTFPHYAISAILDGSVPAKALAGKIVLVGATAIGIYDLRVTPFSPAMPGVEKHANVIASILENKFLRKAPLAVNLILMISASLLFIFLIIHLKAAGAAALTGGSLLLLLGSGYLLFVRAGLWIHIASPSLNLFFIFIAVTAYNYAAEERYARRIRSLFSSYVTERVVTELIKHPELARLGGARREVTVLFSDVRGFTSFSEKHAPEEVVAILNEYLEAMTEVIFRWEGTLDKFIGDAILAFWGAPLPQPNHAELGVRCALHMAKRLKELQEKWKTEGKPVLDAGVGINTGEVLVGNIGAAGKKMDYTVIGDHVNLGSRVESLTRKFNAHILITEYTLRKIIPEIERGKIGHLSSKGIQKVIVKGKKFPVGIYDLSSLAPESACQVIECTVDEVAAFDEK